LCVSYTQYVRQRLPGSSARVQSWAMTPECESLWREDADMIQLGIIIVMSVLRDS
jgi:hypothetical protein